MAFAHLYFNDQTQYGRLLRRGLQMLEDGRGTLIQARDAITFMIDGDGSNAAQFGEVVNRFGFPDNVTAKAAWDELNSAIAKLTTDANVVSVQAALVQLFNKLR